MGQGVPELVLELNGQRWTLDPTRSYAVGRDPQGDLVLDDQAYVGTYRSAQRWTTP